MRRSLLGVAQDITVADDNPLRASRGTGGVLQKSRCFKINLWQLRCDGRRLRSPVHREDGNAKNIRTVFLVCLPVAKECAICQCGHWFTVANNRFEPGVKAETGTRLASPRRVCRNSKDASAQTTQKCRDEVETCRIKQKHPITGPRKRPQLRRNPMGSLMQLGKCQPLGFILSMLEVNKGGFARLPPRFRLKHIRKIFLPRQSENCWNSSYLTSFPHLVIPSSLL